jgi:hypothetical protein
MAVVFLPELAPFLSRRYVLKENSYRPTLSAVKSAEGQQQWPAEFPDPSRGVALLLQAAANNHLDAAVALWALCRQPPSNWSHPEITRENRMKYCRMAARYGSVSAMRKLSAKEISASKLTRDVIKPESVYNRRVFPLVFLPTDLLGA